ncbi:MAG TPA: HAD-IA family hydrolase [Actinomycetes bacterium]|nr:HAD-IA family hydrolase [Actinomycetes bacterium]
MTIRHVLFDADGVLQDVPGGWYAAMEPYLGERTQEFFDETWSDELPMLAGEGDYLPLLAATLEKYGVADPVEVIYPAVWHRIQIVEETWTLAEDLRAKGYGVHLATNQEQYRAAHMRAVLGYDELFDISCYSYDIGAVKPDARFFEEALRRIGAAPAEVLFIDDTLQNVEGARAVGLVAEHWHFDLGHDDLLRRLSCHGVSC